MCFCTNTIFGLQRLRYFFRKFKNVCIILALFSLFSCNSEEKSLQKTYGNDSFYFQGLKFLEAGNRKDAIRYFKKAVKNGGFYTARLSAVELTKIGNIQENLSSCEKLIQKYPDDEALIIFVRSMAAQKEYGKIIINTEQLDLENCKNELVSYRLKALKEKKDSSFEEAVYKWFVSRPYSGEHYKFIQENPNFISDDNKKAVLAFRTEVYNRNYLGAYDRIEEILDKKIFLEKMLISDIGKTFLYGKSQDWKKNADFMKKLAELLEEKSDTERAYYAWFYAARLYEKTSSYYKLAKESYEKAMRNSADDFQYDNALHYFLDFSLALSTDQAINELETYSSTWHDAEFFSDFFDRMSVLLLSAHKWNDFYKIFTIIRNYAASDDCAKFAYLSGRLLQTKLAEPVTELSAAEEAENLFRVTIECQPKMYYRVLAAERLNVSGDELKKLMFGVKLKESFESDTEAEKLLTGFADFGFPHYVYPTWEKFYWQKKALSQKTLKNISNYISKCSDQIPNNLYKSLRIASIACNESEKALCEELLSLAYPLNYSKIVDAACDEFSVESKLIYSIIRTESFFNPEIKSSAGAIGLTQLMESTAGDIARRLHEKEYSLTDPETSIRFGTYYFNNLYERLDKSAVLAAFAYNSGITRVRRWVATSKKELNGLHNLPMDLFLETIPFEETREYGRKIVSAAAVYGWLYFNNSPVETVRQLMK